MHFPHAIKYFALFLFDSLLFPQNQSEIIKAGSQETRVPLSSVTLGKSFSPHLNELPALSWRQRCTIPRRIVVFSSQTNGFWVLKIQILSYTQVFIGSYTYNLCEGKIDDRPGLPMHARCGSGGEEEMPHVLPWDNYLPSAGLAPGGGRSCCCFWWLAECEPWFLPNLKALIVYWARLLGLWLIKASISFSLALCPHRNPMWLFVENVSRSSRTFVFLIKKKNHDGFCDQLNVLLARHNFHH